MKIKQNITMHWLSLVVSSNVQIWLTAPRLLIVLCTLIVLCCTNGTVHINDSVHYLLALCTIKVFDKGKLSQFGIFQL